MTVFPDGKHVAAKWLSFVLLSPDSRNYISLNATGTSGSMKNLPKKSLLSMPVRSPLSLGETQRIADALVNLELDMARKVAHVAKLRALKTGLMQDLLTGRKRVTQLCAKVEV
jgi:type I restriction enzyme S subunit